MAKKVAVLGSGKVGRLVARLLAGTGEYEVLTLDSDEANAMRAARRPDNSTVKNITGRVCDLGNAQDLAAAIKGYDYALSCAPYFLNLSIGKVCKQLGVNYLDLTEDVKTTKGILEMAQGAQTAFIPQCGLAPGFITIAAYDLAKEFTSLETVQMRVGALPTYPHNRLKYNLTWSTDGLINEYGNPCEAVVDGKLTLVAPLEGYETFSIDGCDYEAFNTSGGLGTLADTLQGKVKNLNYKSVRYPGHRDIMELLMFDLKFNEDRQTFKKILERSLPYTTQDVVLIFVTVTGEKNNILSQKSYAKKIYSSEIDGERWGAIQVTTAAGITAVLDLHAQGKLRKSGFIKQEDVDFKDFITNRFGKYYA